MRIPVLNSYVYYKLKDKYKNSFINTRTINEEVARIIVRKGGVPRILIKYVIQELIQQKLVQRVNIDNYNILESDCDKKVRALISFL